MCFLVPQNQPYFPRNYSNPGKSLFSAFSRRVLKSWLITTPNTICTIAHSDSFLNNFFLTSSLSDFSVGNTLNVHGKSTIIFWKPVLPHSAHLDSLGYVQAQTASMRVDTSAVFKCNEHLLTVVGCYKLKHYLRTL